jgi:hypothetical protein
VTAGVVSSAGVKLLAQYRPGEERIDEYSTLIPANEVTALRHEIEVGLRSASREEVAEAVAVLCGLFKVGDVHEDPRVFIQGMIEELGSYPADVLEEMIRRARRKFAWFPSIAEVVAISEEVIEERRRQLRALDRMAAEHRRRHEEARQVLERRRQDREWIAGLEALAAQTHGDAAPLPGDLELASRLRPAPRWCGHPVRWRQALERPWGVTLCYRLAELVRAQQSDPSPDLEAAIAAIEEVTCREYIATGNHEHQT